MIHKNQSFNRTNNFVHGTSEQNINFNNLIKEPSADKIVQVVRMWDNDFVLDVTHHEITEQSDLYDPAELSLDTTITKKIGDLTYRVTLTLKEQKYLYGESDSRQLLGWFSNVASTITHLAVMGLFAFYTPPMGIDADENEKRDQLFLMQQYLNASAEREFETKSTENVAEDKADNKEGGTGTRATGEEGSMGNPNSRDSNKRYGVAGPKDNQDPHIARSTLLREAAEFGMIGLLNVGAGGDPNSPTAIWGRDESLGTDPISARGNMWGDGIGDSFGGGGLGLSGIGEGGGGRGEGIGLGSIGTIGHGAGTGIGQGFGSGHGRLSGTHRPVAPKIRLGTTTINGRLPPEIIQRIVRQNFGRFRACYEGALRNNPNLQGRVSVRFIIGRDGSVANVGNGGSDLPDPSVVSCVIRSFYGLSFPEPKDGIVSVTYPIVFSPE